MHSVAGQFFVGVLYCEEIVRYDMQCYEQTVTTIGANGYSCRYIVVSTELHACQ